MSRVSVLIQGAAWALLVAFASPPSGLARPTQGDAPEELASDEADDVPEEDDRESPESRAIGAYEPWVSGALGAGVFDGQPSAAVDVSLDLAGPRYAMGFGARLRWMREEGLRGRDWDEISEWASLLRYLTHQRESGDVRASFALGQLGGVRLGHGSVLDGYASGVHVDHRRLGAQLRVEGSRFGVEGLVDDVVSPRIVGARVHGYHWVDRIRLDTGVTGVVDFVAPALEPAGDPDADELIGFAVLDGSVRAYSRDRRVSGGIYLDLVAGGAPGVAGTAMAGFHAGAIAEATVGQTAVGLRGELQVGSDGYIGNWFGPLYERDRVGFRAMQSQLEVARAGGLGGSGGAVDAQIAHPRLGDLHAAYRWRPGLGGLLRARVGAPYFRDVQGALWSAVERTGLSNGTTAGGPGAPDAVAERHNWVVAGEMRVRLPRRLFATAELSRLYRDDAGGALPPVWTALIGIGTRVAPYDLRAR